MPDEAVNWDEVCVCGRARAAHFRLSPHGYMKPVPTESGYCHGRDFKPRL